MFLDSFCSTSSWQGWQSQIADGRSNAGVLHRLLPSIGGKQANLHVQGRPATSSSKLWCCQAGTEVKPNIQKMSVAFKCSRSICKRLCWGPFLVEKVKAHEHRSSFCWWQSTLLPEAQASAHHGAQLASLHRRGQLCSTLDAQLLCLDSKNGTAIGLRGRKAQTHAEDVAEPESVTKAGRPVKELLATPSITTRKLFVEANADWRSFGWRQRALVRDAQANADVGAEGVAHIRPAMEANVHSFSSKEWISNCTNANTPHRSNSSTTKARWTSCRGPSWGRCPTLRCQAWFCDKKTAKNARHKPFFEACLVSGSQVKGCEKRCQKTSGNLSYNWNRIARDPSHVEESH